MINAALAAFVARALNSYSKVFFVEDMSQNACKQVSVSELQFHLSRTLQKSMLDRRPFVIARRQEGTHVVMPMSMLTAKMSEALTEAGVEVGAGRQCSKQFTPCSQRKEAKVDGHTQPTT